MLGRTPRYAVDASVDALDDAEDSLTERNCTSCRKVMWHSSNSLLLA